MSKKSTPLLKALKAREITITDLADRLGVNKSTTSRWAAGIVPPERLAEIERKTGIPPHEIRPDLASVFGAAS